MTCRQHVILLEQIVEMTAMYSLMTRDKTLGRGAPLRLETRNGAREEPQAPEALVAFHHLGKGCIRVTNRGVHGSHAINQHIIINL